MARQERGRGTLELQRHACIQRQRHVGHESRCQPADMDRIGLEMNRYQGVDGQIVEDVGVLYHQYFALGSAGERVGRYGTQRHRRSSDDIGR